MMKKYSRYFIGLFVFAVIVSIVTRNRIESNTPDFMLEKYENLREDEALMDSIGGFRSFEYTFNRNRFEDGKELKYTVLIYGTKKDLRFEGVQNKDQKGKWVLTKSKMTIE